MPWRLIFLVSLFLATGIANGAMLWFERLDPPASVVELSDDIRQETFIFTPTKRRENFTRMGLGSRVDKAVAEAARVDKSRARLVEIVQESSDEVANALCTGGRLPPRFAAMALVIEEDDQGVRRVIHGGRGERASTLYTREWFEASLTYDVYEAFINKPNRADNATAVGVTAVLANASVEAMDEASPFDPGFGSGVDLDDVFEEYSWTEKQVIVYFGLMHVLTEIARSPGDGVCGG